jgi:flavin-dependent dehydrogenase
MRLPRWIALVNTLETDLAILGAGPAGCAAAISAAQAGLRVVLVERLGFPRHRPGETLPPGVEPLFKQLGVWEEILNAGFIRHPGQRVAWAGEWMTSLFGGTEEEPWRGFQAWRPVLDAILLRRAAAVGVETWQPCAAVSPVTRQGRVLGVVTDRGAIRSRYLVDATGGGGWLARKLGWAVERHSPRLLASYGYIATEQASEWFWPELQGNSRGWTWMAQVLPRVVAWTRLSLDGHRAEAPIRLTGLPDAQCLALGGASADLTWRLANQAAGPGYFLVGDAALVLDPASSHGVLRALMSGMMAAHLCAQVCRHGLAEKFAAPAYADWLRRWFDHDAKKLLEFYRKLAIPAERLTRRKNHRTEATEVTEGDWGWC